MKDLLGTVFAKFQVGIGGPQIKNSTGTLEVRNAADSAYAALRASGILVAGDSIILNEQSTGSGASWKMTVSRPSTGMTHDLTIIWPSADPSVGQALTVASFASNIVTLQWSSVTAGAQLMSVDTTSLAFGTASPIAMYTAPANAVEYMFEIIIDTPFSGGTPTLSIGITGTTSKYVSTGQVDLTAAAGTIFQVEPGVIPPGTTENVIATYSAGGATAGAARILGYYSVPS
jgi:hypothetical protein